MIVECAGLPGGGKTTICGLVSRPHGGRGSVPLSALRPDAALGRAAWRLLALCAGARPFRPGRLRRGLGFILFLRHCQHRQRAIVLDQGQVQRLWSILADASHFPEPSLDAVLEALAPFAPDRVVWVETPIAVAARRIASRTGGRSRYDGLPPEAVGRLLAERSALLRSLAERYCRATGAGLFELDGNEDPAANAARIDALFDSRA